MASIDYGHGQTNIDHETGIRYGVIPSNRLGEGSFERIQSNGQDLDYADAMDEIKQDLSWSIKSVLKDYSTTFDADDIAQDIIDGLNFEFESTGDFTRYAYKDGNVEFIVCSDGDIFVTKSKYYTLCGLCSPCAPGAGYLETAGNYKTYCLGPDWFDNGVAPYPEGCFLVANGAG